MNKNGSLDDLIERLISRAENKLAEEAKNYDPMLGESITALREAVTEERYDDAIRVAYGIKGAAGTMGWPLASKAAGFMRHALQDKEKIPKAREAIEAHMSTLELIYRDQMKAESKAGVQLIKNLHALLLKYDIQPGA